MAPHDITGIERQVRSLHKKLTGLTATQSLEEIIKEMRRPGWTTPAEFRLVAASVRAMDRQVTILAEMSKELAIASGEITASVDQRIAA
jgi:hypothetical protein